MARGYRGGPTGSPRFQRSGPAEVRLAVVRPLESGWWNQAGGIRLLGIRLLGIRLLGIRLLGIRLLGIRLLGIRLLGIRLLGIRLQSAGSAGA
jgi:hypothetical protein